MTIHCMIAPLHRHVAEIFSGKLSVIKNNLEYRIRCILNGDTNGFSGQYADSRKTPDLKVTYKNAEGGVEVRLVIEAGFAEKMVLLAKYCESPPYHNPLRNLSDEDIERHQFANTSKIDEAYFTMEGECGSVVYRGLAWAGRLSEAFIEIWKRSSETGQAERSRDRVDLFSENLLGLKLSEFLDVDPENDRTISICSQELIGLAKEDLQMLACSRFRDEIIKRMRKRAQQDDEESQPTIS